MNRVKNRRKNEKKSKNNGFFTKLMYLGAILMSIFFLVNTYRSIQLTIEKLEILDQAEIDVEDLRLSNLELLQFSELVKSDFYVELEGRDRLHLSQEDEFVIIISDDLMNSSELDQYYGTFLPVETEDSLPVGLSAWLNFAIEGV
jgi:hypothetical protein